MNILLNFGADILVIIASLGAMAYCMILSRRLSRLTSFDKGLGGAIAVMSAQVDEMKAALREAKAGSDGAGGQLGDLVQQAREISAELEMMIAACHDFAEEAISVQGRDTGEDTIPVAPSGSERLEAGENAQTLPGPDTAPLFGSRRGGPPLQEATASVEPLFRRRKSAAG